MLNLLSTRTVLPILAFLTINVGCGKKIQDDTKSSSTVTKKNLELSGTPALTLSSLGNHSTSYEFFSDAHFVLPEQLLVIKGIPALNNQITIKYNASDDYIEFQCVYSYPGNGNRYNLLRCENPESGRNYGVTPENIGQMSWNMDQGKFIHMDFTNGVPLSEVEVQAIYQAEWI